ncbi:MAG: dicarboxylate/amino acid:cation symporter [Bacilli bacterium]|nr:dicarboxylate/amino acid:cation symporter [Bacilli bacterium]
MKKKFNLIILISLILGVLGGLYIPNFMNNVSFLGTIYINLLKFMIIPVIFTSIMVTIYETQKKKATIFLNTILTFLIMFVVSFLLTTLVVYIIKPWVGFTFENVTWPGKIISFSLPEIITNLFPTNIVTIISNNAILPCLLVATFSGIAASKVELGDKVIIVIKGIKNISNKLLEYIIYITPLGVFALIGNTVANYGTSIIGTSFKYIGTAYLCSIIIILLVMVLPVWIIAKINPLEYIKNVSRIWLMTLTTCSSAATLPYTIKTCNEKFNIPSKITNIVVPLGCTIHMCGGAVSFALLGIFTAQLYGIEITLITYLLMLVSATLINMAAAGIPSQGIVLGATYLSLFGIPLSFIGIYSGFYRLLDMAYTTLNVTGDVTANILINHIDYNKKEKTSV